VGVVGGGPRWGVVYSVVGVSLGRSIFRLILSD